ncbi:MAG TPA: hypothetical protein VHE10_00545 [Candidatus Paceibacterota bacterium]|nr:hypothetical protein [Candidatus Paceibacterota bacterium]
MNIKTIALSVLVIPAAVLAGLCIKFGVLLVLGSFLGILIALSIVVVLFALYQMRPRCENDSCKSRLIFSGTCSRCGKPQTSYQAVSKVRRCRAI